MKPAIKVVSANRLIVAATLALAGLALIARPASALNAPKPASAPVWAWCGVRPNDPNAAKSVAAMANAAGVDATFGPCVDPMPGYTPADTKDRYADAPTYMALVKLNATVGMKTIVYDQRMWDDDPAVRQTALTFWTPELSHIAAWDMGDEFDPSKPEWAILIHRWNIVLGDATAKTAIRPFANHFATALGKALTDLAGSDLLTSFTRYVDDRGVSVVDKYAPLTKNLMCGVNEYMHFVMPGIPPDFRPTPASIHNDMQLLLEAGCDQILVFGGQPVYGTAIYGDTSIVDRTGKVTNFAAATLAGAVMPDRPFVPLTPARLLETRSGPDLGTVDGQANALGVRGRESVTQLQVAGRQLQAPNAAQPNGVTIPADASAVALNLTVTETAGAGYATVFPCGIDLPNAATVNYAANATVSNGLIAKLGASGTVCVFTKAAAHVVVDVTGYYPSGARYTPLPPARLMDTRSGPGLGTIDGISFGIGERQRDTVTELSVTGRGSVPDDATAVALNVTVTEPKAAGFVTVFPCGAARPNAATANFTTQATLSNGVLVPVGSGGRVCLYTKVATHLVVDVGGYEPPDAKYKPLSPERLLETRTGADFGTVDGAVNGIGVREHETETVLQVTGRPGVSEDAAAVALNITVTEPQAPGFITVFPCGVTRPNASSVNYLAGETISNNVIVQTGATGQVCLFTKATTHLVVDIAGFQPPRLDPSAPPPRFP